jgi:hypothetical protein
MVPGTSPAILNREFPSLATNLDPARECTYLYIIGSLTNQSAVPVVLYTSCLIVWWGCAFPENVKRNLMGIFITTKPDGMQASNNLLPEGAYGYVINSWA